MYKSCPTWFVFTTMFLWIIANILLDFWSEGSIFNWSRSIQWFLLYLFVACPDWAMKKCSQGGGNSICVCVCACVCKSTYVCAGVLMCCKFMLRWGLSLRLIHGRADKKHRESESASSQLPPPPHTCTHSSPAPSFTTSAASLYILHPSHPLLLLLLFLPSFSLPPGCEDSQAKVDVGGN